MANRKAIVGVLGAGHVGAHVAYALGMMGVADVVKICDVKEAKAVSERQDLMDAVYFMPHRVSYELVSYEEMGDCDIIINAVGDITLSATGNRDDELHYTAKQTADVIPKVMAGGFDGIFINITNPCDVITNVIAEKSGLPKNRVLGTGTLLDTSRLVSAIAQATGLDHHSFTAYMIGEHGVSQMCPWSTVNFAGKSLSQMEEDPKFHFDKEKIRETATKAGWVTYCGKFCTEYGICSAAATLAKTILHDEKKIFPCSVYLDGEYGETGIYCGVPAVLGQNGVEGIIEYDLTEEEKTQFKACADAIRKNIAKSHVVLGE